MATVGPDDEPATRADVRRVYDKIDALARDLRDEFATASDLANLAVNVGKLEAWQLWALRIIIGAVIVALLGVIISARYPAK